VNRDAAVRQSQREEAISETDELAAHLLPVLQDQHGVDPDILR
jgi:hypothetical protein